MERFYRFADITFRISGQDADMDDREGIMATFRVDGPGHDHSFSYEIVDTLPYPQGECLFLGGRLQVFRTGEDQLTYMGDTASLPQSAHTRISRRGGETRVQVLRSEIPDRIMPRLILNTLEVEHHIVRHGGFLLHASLIEWHGRAILFTAPSGTGKSTQAELWRRFRSARVLNGDRAAVMVRPDGLYAYGIPYCGTSGICQNAKLPIAAIVCLSQAPACTVQPLSGLQAFRNLWEGCSINLWDKEDVTLCTQAVITAVQQLPILHLTCTPDEAAVNTLEAYLKERGL